jgi:hypothetical protein
VGNSSKVASTSRTNAPKANGREPLTFDHLKSRKQPITHYVPVCLDNLAADRFHNAEAIFLEMQAASEADLARASLGNGDVAAEQARQDAIRAEYEDAKAAYEDATVQIVMRTIGRKAYERLVLEHPPTDEQKAQFKIDYGDEATAPYDAEAFAPALVAACCVEPKMTVEEVTVLFEGEFDDAGNEITPAWNMAEVMTLFGEALAVCNLSSVGAVGKG